MRVRKDLNGFFLNEKSADEEAQALWWTSMDHVSQRARVKAILGE